MDDIEFTFNEKPFVNGINNAVKAMGSLASAAADVLEKGVKKVHSFFSSTKEKGSQLTSWGVAKGMMVAQFLIGMFKKVLSNIPEIGRVFQIAGGIITRNFLWPLRQQLIPLLQKVLDWVRDHRAMFVRWGGVLVNVFRAGWQAAKVFYEILKSLFKGFMDAWEGVFGKTTKGLTEIINMAVFKIVVLLTYLQVLLKPVMESIGKMFGVLVSGVIGMLEGIGEGFGDLMGPIQNLIDIFRDLIEFIFGGETAAGDFYNMMKNLGMFIGTTLKVSFLVLLEVLDFMITALKQAWSLIKGIIQLLTGDLEGAWESAKDILKSGEAYGKRSATRSRMMEETFAPPGPRLAPQNVTNRTSNISSKVNVEKIEIVTDQPEKAGEAVVKKLGERRALELRDLLMQEQTTRGEFSNAK